MDHTLYAPIPAPRNHFGRSHRGHAFTLIELLTVIAIIGILAAILIPTVGVVRKTARTAACASNLRQIGLALSLYADEHKDFYPPPKKAWPDYWMALVASYTGRVMDSYGTMGTDQQRLICYDGVFKCPGKLEFKPHENGTGSQGNDYYRASYAMQQFSGDETAAVERASISEPPSRVILVMDAENNHFFRAPERMNSIYFRTERHGSRINILFMDNHVGNHSYNDLERNTNQVWVRK